MVLAGRSVLLTPLAEGFRDGIEALANAETAQSAAGLGLGVEDYATDMGVPLTPESLLPAAFQVIRAARTAGRASLFLPDKIADCRDLQRFKAAAPRSALGATGGFAIHPGQVAVMNRAFAPTVTEQETARRIFEAAENARRGGRAVANLNG